MDLLKAQLARLQQQLSGLTASQKMLAAALTAIMAMTLVWWGRYAGEPEYQLLLNQSFSTDDIASITNHLDARGIKYTVTADKILVPAERKLEILGDLSFAHLLPKRTDAGFDDIVKQMTPWDPADKTDRLWVEAKQRTLEAVIGTFSSVREADVVIDTHDERRFDGHDVTPSAMVNIVTGDNGEGSVNVRKIASGAANLVAGAVAGLSASGVTVVVDGATIPVADKGADGGMPDGDSFVEATRSNEEMFRDKIIQQLQFIKGLYVSVRVSLNTKKVETQETTIDPKNNAHLSITEEEKTTDSTGPGGGAEPGAASNLTTNGAIAIGGAPGGGGAGSGNNTSDETKNTYENRFGQKVQTTVQGPGEATPISASVRVPRSYFIAMYKDLNKGAEPDDASLDTLVKTEENQIRADVKSCTGIASDEAVTVNWYSDTALAMVPAVQPSSVKIPPVSVLLVNHVREIGVGVLALASMFMVMMMVRKGSPKLAAGESDEEKEPEKPPEHLGSETQLVGEVSEGDKTLDGMELDDEAIQTQQVIEQVSSLVTENPDAAANLVKRWLNRS